MLKLFRNLFKKEEDSEMDYSRPKVDAYTKEDLDLIFAQIFTQNGGFFNYEPTLKGGVKIFQKLFNTVSPEKVYCIHSDFKKILNTLKIKHVENLDEDCDFAFIDCESLIAGDGSIMISQDNIGKYKIQDLPKNIVVMGKVHQFVPTKSQGLEMIRKAKPEKTPSYITSLNAKNSQDFLKPEFIKELYLVLIE